MRVAPLLPRTNAPRHRPGTLQDLGGEIRERLIQAGRPAAQLSPRLLALALRKLARHSLVRIDRGFEALDHELVEVEALLEKVLPADRINEMEQRIRNYAAARPPLNGQEGSSLLQGEAFPQVDEEESGE